MFSVFKNKREGVMFFESPTTSSCQVLVCFLLQSSPTSVRLLLLSAVVKLKSPTVKGGKSGEVLAWWSTCIHEGNAPVLKVGDTELEYGFFPKVRARPKAWPPRVVWVQVS